MATMSQRSTYALDLETTRAIKHLAATWDVSQAEVIRRSVRAAQAQQKNSHSPADVVAYYRTQPPLRSRRETNQRIKELRTLRSDDDAKRTRLHAK
jgi:transposase-like protein